jgi:hypothetical protein
MGLVRGMAEGVTGKFGGLVRQARSNDCGVEAYLCCEWSCGLAMHT